MLGIKWRGNTYVDHASPFGLRSAPKIFNAIANFIARVLACQGVTYQLLYLDDYLFLGAPNSQQGREFLTTTLQMLTRLNWYSSCGAQNRRPHNSHDLPRDPC